MYFPLLHIMQSCTHVREHTITLTQVTLKHYTIPQDQGTHLHLLSHFHLVKLTVCSEEREQQQCRDDVGELDWRASENSLALLCSSPSAAAGGNGFNRGRYTKLQWPQTGAGQTLLLTSGISFLSFIFIFFLLFFLFLTSWLRADSLGTVSIIVKASAI